MYIFRMFMKILMINHVIGQSKLKGISSEIKPIEKFTFLVEGDKFTAAGTTRYEQMDILIGIDFEEIRWKEILVELDKMLEAFSRFPFFIKEADLFAEYGGLCLLGQTRFNKFHQHITQCFKYKNEKLPDVPVNLCTKTPVELKNEELTRDLQNIKKRFGKINKDWLPADIKGKQEVQTILFEFCSFFNDFSIVYEHIGDEMLTAMETLSDGIYPELIFGELVRDCNNSINGEGEKFEVIRCSKTNKGYRCQTQITQAVNTKNYIKMHNVHYDEIYMMGHEKDDIFARTSDVRDLKILDCKSQESGDFPICIERDIEEPCKSFIGRNDIHGMIKNCNFTRKIPQIGIIIPHGGILIQGNDIAIANGETSVAQKPPIVIYSPETITLKKDDDEFVFAPAIHIEELTIIESQLSEDDIKLLKHEQKWEEIWEETDSEDYISYVLILLQLVVFPIALYGCYSTIAQRKVLKRFEESGKRGKGKENYKQNQYLLRKI